jgi:hypothetical protein
VLAFPFSLFAMSQPLLSFPASFKKSPGLAGLG